MYVNYNTTEFSQSLGWAIWKGKKKISSLFLASEANQWIYEQMKERLLFHDSNPDTKTYHSKEKTHFRPILLCIALIIHMLVNQIYSKSNLQSASGISVMQWWFNT